MMPGDGRKRIAVDFHDARLFGLELSGDGILEVQLRNLSVFERTESGLSQVYAWAARVVLAGVSRLDVSISWQPDDYVAAGEIDGVDVDEVLGGRILHSVTPAQSFALILGSGKFVIQCSSVRVELLSEERLVQEWREDS
jgi:hypothetical protein